MVTKLTVPPPRRVLPRARSLLLLRPDPDGGPPRRRVRLQRAARRGLRAVRRGWPRHRRVAGWVCGSLVTIVVLVFAARAWFDVRDATARTADSLRDTRQDLGEARDDLATATEELEAAQAALVADMVTLDVRQQERAAAEAALDASTAALNERRGRLDATSSALQADTARLDALKRCVVGASEALNQASVGDVAGAAATVRAIAGTCAQVGVVL